MFDVAMHAKRTGVELVTNLLENFTARAPTERRSRELEQRDDKLWQLKFLGKIFNLAFS